MSVTCGQCDARPTRSEARIRTRRKSSVLTTWPLSHITNKRRKRIHMLHDLANDGGCVALTRAAEDRERWRPTESDGDTQRGMETHREVWRHRERMLETCWAAENTELRPLLELFLCNFLNTPPKLNDSKKKLPLFQTVPHRIYCHSKIRSIFLSRWIDSSGWK